MAQIIIGLDKYKQDIENCAMQVHAINVAQSGLFKEDGPNPAAIHALAMDLTERLDSISKRLKLDANKISILPSLSAKAKM